MSESCRRASKGILCFSSVCSLEKHSEGFVIIVMSLVTVTIGRPGFNLV